MDYPVKNGFVTRLLYLHSVDAVVAISTGVRNALLSGNVPAERIRLIPSGIDTAQFAPQPGVRAQIRSRYGFSEHEIVVLSVGALAERKGHITLLQAARLLRDQGLQLRYLVCGDGPLRATLEAEAHTLEIATDIRFVGFCPDIPSHLAAADVFVHVPLWEGLGVAVIEALAAGLPVVASRVGGIPELIEDATTGLLVPPQNPSALAAALKLLVNDPLRARALGAVGQGRARTRLDVTVMAQANEALYYELLQR
jgi:glycosyltransferase involved in cell wall biosynthesis